MLSEKKPKISEVYEWDKKKQNKQKHYKKCSHYIIGASFDSSICFHYFVLLWYVYDLVFGGGE